MSGSVQVAADARIRSAGGWTDGHGSVRVARAAARGCVPYILVAVRVDARGTAVGRGGRGCGLGTVLVVVRGVGIVIIVVVRAVVDLAAGGRQGGVVRGLLRGP